MKKLLLSLVLIGLFVPSAVAGSAYAKLGSKAPVVRDGGGLCPKC